MAIEFKCSTCGKQLFAQEQYAGMRTTCPGCQAKMPIPDPGMQASAVAPSAALDASAPSVAAIATSQPSAAPIDDPYLVDMETVPRESKSEPPAKHEEAADQKVPELSDATKRCPICAETIKAAAKKCRFCGHILDEDLKREEALNRRRETVGAALLAARRSDALWRSLSILATILTTGWLLFLTFDCVTAPMNSAADPSMPHAPWTLYVFNALLIFGLFTLIRQMKAGPYHVFLAAAFAIVACTPLNIALGLPLALPSAETFAELKSKNEIYKDFTAEQFAAYYKMAAMVVTGLFGLAISLPVWFTALKLALQARIAKRLK